ncbi:hypothetical protein [Halobaculum sp. MBLA0143]|uniref:hypothetical protein n=1 Tax=Halobaculum sp. MBLA0143 TaxID=3079933 RepID=UPI003524BEE1
MNRRRFLRGVIASVSAVGVAGAARVFEVEQVDFEVIHDRPERAYALGRAGVVDAEELDRSAETAALSSFAPSVAEALRTVAGVADNCGDCDGVGDPSAVREALAGVEWVVGFGDDHARAFAVVPTQADGPPPVAVEAAAADGLVGPGAPATFALTARNRSDRAVVVFGGPPEPFGHVTFEAVDGRGSEFVPTFFPDAPLSHLPPLRSLAVQSSLSHERYDPGAATTRRYQLRATERTTAPGRYEATGSFRFGTLVPSVLDTDGVQIPTTAPASVWSVEWTLGVRIAWAW